MNIEELRKKLEALRAEAKKLAGEVGTDDWTDDKSARADVVMQEIKDTEKTIKYYQDLVNAAGENAAPPAGSVQVTRNGGSDGPFAHLGEQLIAIRDAGLPNGRVDERLLQVQAAAGDGSTEGVPSEAGYLIQTDFAQGILKNIWENNQVISRCSKRTISSNANSLKINSVDETSRANGSRSGGVVMYWEGEEDQYTASKPKFAQMKLELNKLTGLYFASEEVMADASFLSGDVNAMFQDEIDFKVQDAIIRGTGSGQPMGILNAPCKVNQAKETGQAAATVLYENIIKMWARMPVWLRGNCVWIANQEVEPLLDQMYLAVGTGGVPVYMPAGGVSGSSYGSLKGKPVIYIEQCEAPGTVGDIMLCAFDQYIVADKGNTRFDSSIHLKFDYGQTAFRWMMRMDGQPRWRSALTPYKGSATLSPFLALATRS